MADKKRDLKNSGNRLGHLDPDSTNSKAGGVDTVLMSTLDALPVAVAVTDIDGVVAYCNSAFYSLMGGSAQATAGRTLREVLPGLPSGYSCSEAKIPEPGGPTPVIPPDTFDHTVYGANRHFRIRTTHHVTGGTCLLLHTINDITAHTQLKVRRESELRQAGERIKEIKCLYSVSQSLRQYDNFQDALIEIVRIIPRGTQYPAIARVRIVIGNHEYVSEDFQATVWKISSKIVVGDTTQGVLEVHYTEPRRNEYEGPFLLEERVMLDDIAQVLANTIEQQSNARALEESERRYRTIFHTIPDIVLLTRMRDGTILQINDGMTTIAGFTEGDCLGRTTTDIGLWTRAEDRLVFLEHLQETGSIANEEVHFSRKDGTPFIALISSTVVNIEDESFLLSVIRDITRRTEEQKQLDDIKNRNTQILQAMTNGYMLGTVDGHILEVNQAYCDMVGYTRQELQTMTIHDLDASPDEQFVERNTHQTLTEEDRHFEVQHRAKDGRIVDLDVSATVMHFKDGPRLAVFLRDVTESKAAAKRIRQSEERLRSMAENMPVMLSAIDEDGLFLVWNKEAERVTGYTADEMIGNPEAPKVLYPDAKELEKRVGGRKKLTQDFRDETTVITCKDGSLKTISYSTVAAQVPIPGWSFWSVGIDITARVEAERKLRESEETFSTVFKTGPDAVTLNRESDGLYIDVNDTFLSLTGYSYDEVIGRTSLELNIWAFAEDRARLIELLTTHGHVSNMEAPFLRKDGTTLTGLISSRRLVLGGVECIISVTRDITQRQAREEALRESRRTLATLMSNLPGMAYRCLNTPEWPMEFVSERCYELTGYSDHELCGEHPVSFGSLIHADDRNAVWKSIQGAIKDKSRYTLVYRLLTKDGSEKWVWEQGQAVFDNRGSVVALEGFITDVTATKKAEDELRRSEQKYRLLIETMHEGILQRDPEGILTFANDRMCSMLGYKPEEMIGRPVFEFLDDENAEIVKKQMKARQSGRGQTYELSWLRKNGSSLITLVSAGPILDTNGKTIGAVAVITDISERKEAELALQQTTDALKEERAVLEEKNIALRQILANLDEERKEFQRVLYSDLINALTPAFDSLMKVSDTAIQTELMNLQNDLRHILTQRIDPFSARFARLTAREIEICELIQNGLSSKEISERLNVSPLTIHKHRESIRRKLGIQNKDVNLSTYLRSH